MVLLSIEQYSAIINDIERKLAEALHTANVVFNRVRNRIHEK